MSPHLGMVPYKMEADPWDGLSTVVNLGQSLLAPGTGLVSDTGDTTKLLEPNP